MNFRTIALIEALLRRNLDAELQRYQFSSQMFERTEEDDERYEDRKDERNAQYNRYQAAQAAYDDFIEVTWSMK